MNWWWIESLLNHHLVMDMSSHCKRYDQSLCTLRNSLDAVPIDTCTRNCVTHLYETSCTSKRPTFKFQGYNKIKSSYNNGWRDAQTKQLMTKRMVLDLWILFKKGLEVHYNIAVGASQLQMHLWPTKKIDTWIVLIIYTI